MLSFTVFMRPLAGCYVPLLCVYFTSDSWQFQNNCSVVLSVRYWFPRWYKRGNKSERKDGGSQKTSLEYVEWNVTWDMIRAPVTILLLFNWLVPFFFVTNIGLRKNIWGEVQWRKILGLSIIICILYHSKYQLVLRKIFVTWTCKWRKVIKWHGNCTLWFRGS